jgi:hypothetical protein
MVHQSASDIYIVDICRLPNHYIPRVSAFFCPVWRGVYLYNYLISHLGEGLAFAKRTLPRKKPNAIALIIHISPSMAFVFLTPLPMRKVCHDKFFLSSEFVVKPPATPSFMDYIF